MKLFLKFVLIGVFVFLTKGLSATNYYVNDNSTVNDVYTSVVGNNANDGFTVITPKATLTNVLSTYVLGATDTVFIDAGTYFQTDRNLTIPSNVVVIGAGMNLTVFDNDFDAATGYYFAKISSDVTLKGIRVTRYGQQLNTSVAHALDILSNATSVNIIDVQVDNCGWTTGAYPIEIHSGAEVNISGGGASCNASGINSGGIRIEGATTVVNINDYLFIFSDRESSGSALRVNSGTCKVYNSLFDRNVIGGGSAAGILYQSGGDLQIYDCKFDGNKYRYTFNAEYGGTILVNGGTFYMTRSIVSNTDKVSS